MKRVLWAGCAVGACLAASLGALRLAAVETGPSTSKETSTPSAEIVLTGPKIQFDGPVYEFGKVLCGAVVKHDFPFRNIGDGPLVINDVHSTCGCTSATNTSKLVGPGKKGVISVEFNTLHFSGPVTKAVTVKSNDTNQPIAELQVKGTVWRPIDVTPAGATFTSRADSPSNEVRVVRIVNNQDKPLVLSALQINQKTISAELKTNEFGKEYELVVKLVPPLGAGNVFGQITLKTSSTEVPVVTVPVFALARAQK